MREWISVNDRLHELNHSVLTWSFCYEILTGFCRESQYGGDIEWCSDIDNIDISVTHWMPLPEPPEVE